jgi:Tol biopolymer transport system component
MLDPRRWAEVRRLHERASGLPPAELPGFLEREGADQEVQREVRSLLEYSAAELRTAGAEIAGEISALARDTDPDQQLIGARIGPYKVEAIAGHGGMGAVYRALRDDAEFHQQVAIKLLRAAAQSPSTLQRFKRERQILASLQHPNIARLLDGGSTRDGVPYLVMEFIEGEAITAWCEHHTLKLEQRLRLFLQVCEAVEFAHRHLVVHRDLKPSNILVAVDGTPKLLDFGIAKMLVADTDNPAVTVTGTQMMTPEYASPEQVRGDPVSPAVDVYALGLILYELLTGEKAQKIPDSAPSAVAWVVCQTEPVAPAVVKPQLAGDLDNIIRAAIRKEHQRRYRSVAELARDIQSHLEGRPVTARPDTFAYRTGKFLQRNRATLTASLVVGGILSGGLGLANWIGAAGKPPRVRQVTQITRTGHVALLSGLVTDGVRVFMSVHTGGIWSLAQVAVQGGTPQPLPDGPPNPYLLDISPDRARLLVASGPGMVEDVPLWDVPTAGGASRRIGSILGHTGAWSQDGQSIIFGHGAALYRVKRNGSGLHKVLDVAGRADEIRVAPAPQPEVVRFTVTQADTVGRDIWEARSDGSDLHLVLPNWNRRAGLVRSGDNGNWIAGGKYYLFRSVRDGVARIWTMKEGSGRLGLFLKNPVEIYSTPLELYWLAPAPDGRRVFYITGQERREFARYDAARRQFVPSLPGVSGRWFSFSKDGRWLAYTTVAPDTLWRSRPDGSEAIQLTPPDMTVSEPDWSPDGLRILCSVDRRTMPAGVYVVPVAGGAPESIAAGYVHASWSPDGGTVLLTKSKVPGNPSAGLYLRNWQTRTTTLIPGSEALSQGRWSPDGRYIVATQRDGLGIQLYELKTRRWARLASGNGLGPPFWSKDSKYMYYQESFGSAEQPTFRLRISSRRIERIAGSRQIPQSDLAGYSLAGLTPDDAPIAAVIRANSDVYALDLDLP